MILFDVDGTLIDSAPGILNTLEEVFHKMNVDISGTDLRRYLGPPLRKSSGAFHRPGEDRGGHRAVPA